MNVLEKTKTFSANFHPTLFTRVDRLAKYGPCRATKAWCSSTTRPRLHVQEDKSFLTCRARADLPTCFVLQKPQLCIFSKCVSMSLALFFSHRQILHSEYNVSYESNGNVLVPCTPGTNLQQFKFWCGMEF